MTQEQRMGVEKVYFLVVVLKHLVGFLLEKQKRRNVEPISNRMSQSNNRQGNLPRCLKMVSAQPRECGTRDADLGSFGYLNSLRHSPELWGPQ